MFSAGNRGLPQASRMARSHVRALYSIQAFTDRHALQPRMMPGTARGRPETTDGKPRLPKLHRAASGACSAL